MIDNPLVSDFVKKNIALYPETLQSIFSAVNNYAYRASAPIEGPLGEGYGIRNKPIFIYHKLLNAIRDSIDGNIKDKSDFSATELRNALALAAMTDTELDEIIEIIKQEAITRIDQATSPDRTEYDEHGHHGRQYIASRAVERTMKEVFPLRI